MLVVALVLGWIKHYSVLREQIERLKFWESKDSLTVHLKERDLARIEALITHPQDGEDTIAEISHILQKRELPKFAAPRHSFMTKGSQPTLNEP